MKDFIINIIFMICLMIMLFGFIAVIVVGIKLILRLILGKAIISTLKRLLVIILLTSVCTAGASELSSRYDTLL